MRRKAKLAREEALKNTYSWRWMVAHTPPTPGFRRLTPVPLMVTLRFVQEDD